MPAKRRIVAACKAGSDQPDPGIKHNGVCDRSNLSTEDAVKKKLAITALVSLTVLMVSMQLFSAAHSSAVRNRILAPSPSPADVIAGPGRIEPISEDIELGSELGGKLKSVIVEEGDPVRKGQVLALLENDDYRAELASASAQVQEKEANLRKVTNG